MYTKKMTLINLLFTFFLLILLSACSKVETQEGLASASEVDSEVEAEINDADESNETSQPEIEEVTDWIISKTSSVDHLVNTAQFYDELSAVTVGYNGTTFYTEDGGETWTEASNQSLCRYGISRLSKDTIVSCGNGGENRISTDGGKTWDTYGTFPLVASEPHQFIFMIDADTLWVGGKNALAYTSDGGQTYINVPLPEEINQVIAMDFTTASTGYLMGDDGYLYSTQDCGTTFTKASDPLAIDPLINTSKSKSLVTVTNGQILFVNYRSNEISIFSFFNCQAFATLVVKVSHVTFYVASFALEGSRTKVAGIVVEGIRFLQVH